MTEADAADRDLITAAQMRAMSHPTRIRIWRSLGGEDATISQLSNRLAINKGGISHHLRVLAAAGLVEQSRSRTVRGGTELYFRRTSPRIAFRHERGDDATSTAAVLEAADALVNAADAHVHQRSVRLTPEQARGLQNHLDEVLHRLEPADERHPRYAVLVAVHREQ